LYLDSDVLVREDVAEIEAKCVLENAYKAVYVVKHEYEPKDEDAKFLGERQTRYAKKNWSSVMLFNAMRCRRLTPEYVDTASGLDLHQFKWTTEDQVGELHKDWNHLVGEGGENPQAKIVHFTRGGPWFTQYRHSEFAKEWLDEFQNMSRPM